jgi:hypothetical protein
LPGKPPHCEIEQLGGTLVVRDDNPFTAETGQHDSRDEGWSQAQREDDEADGA